MDFKKLLRLLIPIMVEGALAVRRDSQNRLIEMLHQLEFVTRDITSTSDYFSIELQILDVDLLYRLLVGEANKFLLASRISHDRSNQSQVNNASWQTVEHYYAAYYGVHYLLRLTGISITNLDSRSASAITRSSFWQKNPLPIPTGLYVMRYNNLTQILTLKKNVKKGPGGSHQEVWKLWEELVEKLKSRTDSDLVEYISTAVDLAAHKSFLTKSTAKYNPPDIRNEINYQFKGGSWVFEANSRRSIDRIQRSIADTHSEILTQTSTPEGLVSNNKIIIGLAKAVFLHAADKYPKSICRSLASKYSSFFT